MRQGFRRNPFAGQYCARGAEGRGKPNTPDEGVTRRTFADARRLFDDLRAQDEEIQILSMGMSHDAHIALEEGSTLVRLGTSIFGRREGYGPETEAIK